MNLFALAFRARTEQEVLRPTTPTDSSIRSTSVFSLWYSGGFGLVDVFKTAHWQTWQIHVRLRSSHLGTGLGQTSVTQNIVEINMTWFSWRRFRRHEPKLKRSRWDRRYHHDQRIEASIMKGSQAPDVSWQQFEHGMSERGKGVYSNTFLFDWTKLCLLPAVLLKKLNSRINLKLYYALSFLIGI